MPKDEAGRWEEAYVRMGAELAEQSPPEEETREATRLMLEWEMKQNGETIPADMNDEVNAFIEEAGGLEVVAQSIELARARKGKSKGMSKGKDNIPGLAAGDDVD